MEAGAAGNAGDPRRRCAPAPPRQRGWRGGERGAEPAPDMEAPLAQAGRPSCAPRRRASKFAG